MAQKLFNQKYDIQIMNLQHAHMDSFRALHAELLPVQYGDKFYRELMTLPHRVSRVSLVAVAHYRSTVDDANGIEDVEDAEDGDMRPLRPLLPVIVGVATGRVKDVDTCCSHPTGYIMTLGTNKSYRGSGIGGRLLDTLVARLHQLGAIDISLHCTTTNEAAIGLYVSRGFQLVQKFENHYRFYEKYHDAYEFVLWGKQSCPNLCCYIIAWIKRTMRVA